MAATVRRTYSIPVDLDDDLSYIAQRLGFSRSAMLAQFLNEALSDLAGILREIPEDPEMLTDDVIRRARGRSGAVLGERMEQLRRLEDDLFSDQ